MPDTTPLLRTSLSNQIRDVLLKRVMSGELKPGDRLIEMKIAAEMSTSQAPVREALRELETLGVIEILRNKGARVRIISNAELQQIYDVRAQLEAYATGLVAELKMPIKSRLRESVRQMKKAARLGDSIEFANTHTDFHRCIMEATDNQVLLDTWETLIGKARTMVNVSRSSSRLLELSESHQPIITAIHKGDSTNAFEVARAHVLTNKPVSALVGRQTANGQQAGTKS